MKHSDTRPEASPEPMCVCCGALDYKTNPLPWQMDFTADTPSIFDIHYYCERCYRDARRLEEAEEAVIAAIKAARLHETYTTEHLKTVLDSLGGNETVVLAEAIERGTMSRFEPRPVVEPKADKGT